MSDYIMELRKTVGHRLLLGVGVGVLVLDSEGRLLLQRRSDNGCWDYAGGAAEPDEDVEAAARRELEEETGLRAASLELFGVFSGPDCHFYYPNGDEVSYVILLYTCRDYSGALAPQPGEVEELRFFAPDELPGDISPVSRRPLSAWLEQHKEV